METTCIVVANAGRARFFFQQGDAGELQEAADMVNTAVRLRTAQTESDRLGPTSAGKSSHNTGGAVPNKTYEPPHSPAEQETERFARSIVMHLQQQLQREEFDRLALVAAPELLGMLRGMLTAPLQHTVCWDINKDYTSFNAPQLRDQIAGHTLHRAR